MSVIWQDSSYQSVSWMEEGVRHGFGGVPANGVPAHLIFLEQCHSTTIVTFDDSAALAAGPCRADGSIARRGIGAGDSALAIRTADCLPVLAYSKNYVAAVHAGWRGLAAGILQSTARLFAERGEPDVAWIIGPAAGPDRYEVGEDILPNFCFAPVARPIGGGKVLLDLAASARHALVESSQDPRQIEVVAVDTIADPRFHSYRRDGAAAGRNISWIGI